jgi:hypothetical protein
MSNTRLKAVGLVLILVASLGTAVVRKGLPADLTTVDVSHLTVVVLLEAVSWMAYPIYAWLLYSGFAHTRSVARYGARLAMLAVVSEVPYDLATSGRPWDMSSQNPVFALVVCLVVLAALEHLRRHRTLGRAALSVAVCVAAILWLVIFNVGLRFGVMPGGVVMLLFVLVFYAFHRRENTMMAFAAVVGAVALIFPALGLAFVHFRNDTVGAARARPFFYVAYPVCLLAAGLLGLAL